MFFARVGRHLGELSDFVRHRIAYLEATGDRIADELAPDDVIDEVLLRENREFDSNMDDDTLRRRLAALARDTLAAAVKSAQAWRRRPPAYRRIGLSLQAPSDGIIAHGRITARAMPDLWCHQSRAARQARGRSTTGLRAV